MNQSVAGTAAVTSFIAVVPARLASTRLPGKPLADLGGKPMVVRVAERAQASGAQQVLIASDAQSVIDAARAHGFDAMLTRADHPSGTDRLAEVAERFGWPDETLIVNVQGDEPLIDPVLIRDVAAHLAAHPDCAIATAAHPITAPQEIFSPNVVKVVLDMNGVALYFSRAPIPWARDAWHPHWSAERLELATIPAPPSPAVVYRHIGLYAYRAKFLRSYPSLAIAPLEQVEMLEQLRAMWHGARIAVLVSAVAPAPGVDTPADLARVQALFRAKT